MLVSRDELFAGGTGDHAENLDLGKAFAFKVTPALIITLFIYSEEEDLFLLVPLIAVSNPLGTSLRSLLWLRCTQTLPGEEPRK